MQEEAAEPANSDANDENRDDRPVQQQQAAGGSRKRRADGLRNELVGLPAIAGWDADKLRNLDAFFNRCESNTGRSAGVGASKRQRMEWEAGATTATAPFRLGHNKPRPGGGDVSAGLRGASPGPWCVASGV